MGEIKNTSSKIDIEHESIKVIQNLKGSFSFDDAFIGLKEKCEPDYDKDQIMDTIINAIDYCLASKLIKYNPKTKKYENQIENIETLEK